MREIVNLLKDTLDPLRQSDADGKLRSIAKAKGFPSSLLQICISDTVNLVIRQAAVLYLKNVIRTEWSNGELSVEDKDYIRENILPAICCSHPKVCKQLSECVRYMIPSDFPEKWPNLHVLLRQYIESDRADMIISGLIVLHELVKHFEYKLRKEREVFLRCYTPLLPGLLERLNQLINDTSDYSLRIQHLILKGFSRFIQISLPLECFTLDSLERWLVSLCAIIDRNPTVTIDSWNTIDEDCKASHPVWRCAKWASRIINRIMEKYGSPKTVSQEYAEFSNYFLKGFSDQIISVCMNVFKRYADGEFVLESVLYELLIYFSRGVSYAFFWNLASRHVPFLIEKVVYRQLCITEEEEDLFESEPVDFMSLKHDLYGDFESSVYASRTFLSAVCSKREAALSHTMSFCQQIVTVFDQLDYKKKDGLFHILGTICNTLMKKTAYKSQLEQFLVQIVQPEVNSSYGCLRFRALWTLEMFRSLKLSPEAVVVFVNSAYDKMMNDESDVVKVEAAAVLVKYSLKYKNLVKPVLVQNTRILVIRMLDLIRTIEYDEVPRLFKDLLGLVEDELPPIAVDVARSLASTFVQMVSTGEDDDSLELGECKSLAAAEILQVLSKIAASVDGNSSAYTDMEIIVAELILFVIQEGFVDFYSEMSDLTFFLTKDKITARMWDILPQISGFFLDYGSDYFLDMVPTLYNYICVDSVAFFERKMASTLLNIFKEVMEKSTCNQSKRYASKLMEVVVVQSILVDEHGFFADLFVFILRNIPSSYESDLDAQILQTNYIVTMLAAFYVNCKYCTDLLSKSLNVLPSFLSLWLGNLTRFRSLHTRLVSALAMSKLIYLCVQVSSAVDAADLAKCVLAALTLLKKSYIRRKAFTDSTDDDSDYDEDASVESYRGAEARPDQDGDIVVPADIPYANQFKEEADNSGESIDQRRLDCYSTVLDDNDEVNAFTIMCTSLQDLKVRNASYHERFMAGLSSAEREELADLFEFGRTLN